MICSKNEFGVAKRNKSIIKLLLVEFLAFALKNDAIFESSEFQAYLGYGKNLFFLKENYFMDISLLQYVVDQKEEMTKELEELAPQNKIDLKNEGPNEDEINKIVSIFKLGEKQKKTASKLIK